MIDKQQIKREVDNYVNEWNLGLLASCPDMSNEHVNSLVETMRNSLDFGICRGAEMYLESLWHDASEEPERGKQIITQWLDNGEYSYEVDCLLPRVSWTQHICDNNIAKWCYLEDLFPENKNK